jgi:capsular exopolysaccharide synthesis family protein
LEIKKQEAALKYLEGHPTMRAIQAEIDAMNTKLEAELATSMEALNHKYNEIQDHIKQLKARLPEFDKTYTEFLRSQQKDQLAKRKMLPIEGLMGGLEKAIQNDQLSIDNDRMQLSYGGLLQINDIPISPNRFALFMYTTILGVMLVIGIPFLVEYLDHTLSNLEQVESTFQLRGLGIIPKVDNADTSVALLDSPEAKEQRLLENFRVIRTNLLSMGSLSKPPHVLMVTSAMPKEGKTVVSTNLALSFAQTGGKTLLMDTDLRRGRLHRFFGYRKQPGLSGVLLNQCTLDEAIRPTPHENLFIVSAGQHLETGTELLGSPKFHELMQELRKRFDRIILDTPPVLGLSETSVLQNQVDGVLFVIWSGYTPIKGVKAAIEMLQANGANFYGFVLNRLDLNATANYYQYYYYSHDYYYQYSPRNLENV